MAGRSSRTASAGLSSQTAAAASGPDPALPRPTGVARSVPGSRGKVPALRLAGRFRSGTWFTFFWERGTFAGRRLCRFAPAGLFRNSLSGWREFPSSGLGRSDPKSWHPEWILMDIGLPRMTGLAAAEKIRRRPWGRDVVLVAVTGWGDESDRRRSTEPGFDRTCSSRFGPKRCGRSSIVFRGATDGGRTRRHCRPQRPPGPALQDSRFRAGEGAGKARGRADRLIWLRAR